MNSNEERRRRPRRRVCCSPTCYRFITTLIVLSSVLLGPIVIISQTTTITGFVVVISPTITARRRRSTDHIMTIMSNSAITSEDNDDDNDNNNHKRNIIDRSTLTLLEHINLNVPSHEYILPFYYKVLGCGMDPRKALNLLPDATKKTLWANCGSSQFHLPYDSAAQRIPGKIGLRYSSLDGLQQRLEQFGSSSKCVKESSVIDASGGTTTIQLVDQYNNVFWCREGGDPVSNDNIKHQPIIFSTNDAEEWGEEIVAEYGLVDESDCKGIDFVEFMCPIGTAERIATFYDSVFDATTSVVEDTSDGKDTAKIAIIGFGSIDDHGRADQSILFRETTIEEQIPPYDGHHIAFYVGETQADFERAFKNCEMSNVVWVNPRFSDKATNLQGAKKWKQFRFKDIVDMETGKPIFELEQEVRSVEHESWPGIKTS